MAVVFDCRQELIQNADDAQATEVIFIHDERRYGTESLWTDELGEYQGMREIQRLAFFLVFLTMYFLIQIDHRIGSKSKCDVTR